MLKARRAGMVVRWSSTLVAAGLAACAAAGCDVQSSTGNSARQVTVVGSGQVQGVPDILTVEGGIEFSGTDVTTAMNQASERQNAVIDALIDAGVDRKDIATAAVSLQPQYGGTDSTGSAAITGYRASNTIRVKVARESASQVLAVIVSTGGDAARINSVSYSIDDDSQLVRAARTHAFEDAKERAEQYAELSGLALGRVISISEASGGVPPVVPVPRSAMAAPVPVEPGQQTVSFSVTAVWELR